MEIASIRHKSLGSLVARTGKMLAFITAAADMDELDTLPNYGLHELKGDRAGEWAMTVFRNWRMTFPLTENDALIDLDLEDYH
jgi:proteic killer suppression protein